jgi:ribulose-phosphate 3-epimerase
MQNIKIAPSILSADFSKMGEEVRSLQECGADLVHCDVMDGVFVPNISFGFPIMEACKKHCTKPLDVHLMITHPEKYVERFCDAGAWSVGFHIEAVEDPMHAIELIRKKGVRTCLTINPKTDIHSLDPYLGEVDMVLLMSVQAGYGGQGFIPESLERLRYLRQTIDERGFKTLIEVDGGVNAKWAPELWKAGADILVAGSAVFNASNPIATIEQLKQV